MERRNLGAESKADRKRDREEKEKETEKKTKDNSLRARFLKRKIHTKKKNETLAK